MTEHLSTAKLPHIWSSEALMVKAQRYSREMLRCERDSWLFVLWSALVLEFVMRATLAYVHPSLLAEAKDWNNLYYSLGHLPKAKKFVPRSIETVVVIERLGEVLPTFDAELRAACSLHVARRNEEIHTGSTCLDGLRNSVWLPAFYRSLEVLLESMDLSLKALLGDAEDSVAQAMMLAAKDESAKAVAEDVKAHKKVWQRKSEEDRAKLAAQALAWASRHLGHVVPCPACSCYALLTGEPISAPTKSIKGDEITEKQQYLPSKFECVACGLKVAGLSRLSACSLGDVYKMTQTYDAAEYYAPEPDEYPEYEPDFNEP